MKERVCDLVEEVTGEGLSCGGGGSRQLTLTSLSSVSPISCFPSALTGTALSSPPRWTQPFEIVSKITNNPFKVLLSSQRPGKGHKTEQLEEESSLLYGF